MAQRQQVSKCARPEKALPARGMKLNSKSIRRTFPTTAEIRVPKKLRSIKRTVKSRSQKI